MSDETEHLITKLLVHATDRGKLRKIIRWMCLEFDKKQALKAKFKPVD